MLHYGPKFENGLRPHFGLCQGTQRGRLRLKVRIYWERRPLRTLRRWVTAKELECVLTMGSRTENLLKKLDAPLFCVPRNPSQY